MPFYVGTTVGGLVAGTVYYVQAITNTTTFTVSATSGGTALTTAITTTTGQSVTLYAAGWDHAIPGKTTLDTLDLSTTYIIEPRITYSGPGYDKTARTLATSATWKTVTYGAGTFVAIPSATTTATSYSSNGTTWAGAGNMQDRQQLGQMLYMAVDKVQLLRQLSVAREVLVVLYKQY